MPQYKDAVNLIPHNFANNVLKITSLSAAYDTLVDGLDSFSADDQADQATWESVGDGLGQFAIDPDNSAVFTFSMMDGNPSSEILWNLLNNGELFSLSFSDPAAPEFDCSGAVCKFVRRPTVDRTKEKPMVEWAVLCGYANIRGGSFTLVSI